MCALRIRQLTRLTPLPRLARFPKLLGFSLPHPSSCALTPASNDLRRMFAFGSRTLGGPMFPLHSRRSCHQSTKDLVNELHWTIKSQNGGESKLADKAKSQITNEADQKMVDALKSEVLLKSRHVSCNKKDTTTNVNSKKEVSKLMMIQTIKDILSTCLAMFRSSTRSARLLSPMRRFRQPWFNTFSRFGGSIGSNTISTDSKSNGVLASNSHFDDSKTSHARTFIHSDKNQSRSGRFFSSSFGAVARRVIQSTAVLAPCLYFWSLDRVESQTKLNQETEISSSGNVVQVTTSTQETVTPNVGQLTKFNHPLVWDADGVRVEKRLPSNEEVIVIDHAFIDEELNELDRPDVVIMLRSDQPMDFKKLQQFIRPILEVKKDQVSGTSTLIIKAAVPKELARIGTEVYLENWLFQVRWAANTDEEDARQAAIVEKDLAYDKEFGVGWNSKTVEQLQDEAPRRLPIAMSCADLRIENRSSDYDFPVAVRVAYGLLPHNEIRKVPLIGFVDLWINDPCPHLTTSIKKSTAISSSL